MPQPLRESLLIAMALLNLPGFGAGALRSVLTAAYERRKPLHKWIDSSPEALARALDVSVATRIIAHRPLNPAAESRELQAHIANGGSAYLLTDAGYPAALKDMAEPPPLLFLVGNEQLLARPAGAVAGARKADEQGLQLAAESAAIIASEGTVVSGGADGVDIAAHEAAVAVKGGATVIVLPVGVGAAAAPDFVYPAINQGRVLALSAEMPFSKWETHQAVGRNPIIAALARVVVVIDPDKTGGSIRTAKAALDLGRRVFVWGSERRAETVERLLASGAHPLVDEAGAVRADALLAALREPPAEPEGEAFLF